jgi:hypothetical protein
LSGDDGNEWLVTQDGEVVEKRPELQTSDREMRNLVRANVRAVGELRRYCVKNRLLKMLTLTFAEPQWDRNEVKHQVNALSVRW